MDVSQYIDLPASWIISLHFFLGFFYCWCFQFTFVHSYRGRRNGVWNVRVKVLPQRHYCLRRTDICCLSKVAHARGQLKDARTKKKNKKQNDDSIFVLFEKCSYFSSPGRGLSFGGEGFTVQMRVRGISDGHELIFFECKCSYCAKRWTWTLYEEKKNETLRTRGWPLFLTNDRRWTLGSYRNTSSRRFALLTDSRAVPRRAMELSFFLFFFFFPPLLIVGTESCRATAPIGQP